MKTKIIYSVFLLVYFVMLGCKYETTTTIYIGDLFEVQRTKKTVNVESIVRVEVPSRESFNEYKPIIKQIIGSYYQMIGDIYYEESGFNSYATTKVNIPLISAKDDNYPKPHKPFMYFIVRDKKELPEVGFGTCFKVVFAKNRLRRFQNDIKNEFYDTIEPEEYKLNVILYNDQKQALDVLFMPAYVDGEASPFGKRVQLQSRRSVKSIYPPIYVAYSIQEGEAAMAFIKD